MATMNETTKTIRAYAYNNNGTLVCAVDVASRDEGRYYAARWNRDETRPGMRVDVIRFSDGYACAVY
jgi:hypothetical protein